MIMMRPAPGQKVGKPPPPVPPRPSKSAVAEALAKSRYIKGMPTRQAPPPPPADLTKCRSAVNVVLRKPPIVERSISEELKNGTRPVVYQSANAKCANNNNINNSKVQITSKDGDVKIVSRTESFRDKDTAVQVVRRDSTRGPQEGVNSSRPVSRRPSEKREDDRPKREAISYARSNSNTDKSCDSSDRNAETGYDSGSAHSSLEKRKSWDKMLNDRNHVNTLIDEMFASVLEVQFNEDETPAQDKTKMIINTDSDVTYENVKIENGTVSFEENVPKTIIVIKNETCDIEEGTETREDGGSSTNSVEREKQVKFKDQLNHELLIKELQCMKIDQEKILKRQRKPSMNIYGDSAVPESDIVPKIEPPDWSDAGDGEIKLSTCHITINHATETEDKKSASLDYDRITKMSSLHGLPPLPKSLSGFNLLEAHQGNVHNPPTPMRSSSMRVPPGHLVYPPHPKMNGSGGDMSMPPVIGTPGRKSTNLDTQLAILRREMYSLRQLDLSLLSQLWSLNESIQDFRQILQDQEDRVLSPPSPSPTPSSGDDADADEFYMSASSLNFRPAPPPPPPGGGVARRPSSSSNASSLG